MTVSQDWLTGSRQATGVTDSGIVLAPSVLRQLACDADILPIVLGGDSQPLDVGRQRRTVTDSQPRALIARDRGCVWEHCNAPALQCHAHHIEHWTDGGPTDLHNLALLCHLRHTHIHHTGWTLTGVGDRWILHQGPPSHAGPDVAVTQLFPRTG